MVFECNLCGWKVSSDIPLPHLAPWRGSSTGDDLQVALLPTGACPLPSDVSAFQFQDDGSSWLVVSHQAAFHVNPQGTRVDIAPLPKATPQHLEAFLLGSVLALICYRRGLLPLHASCVRLGTKAVAIAGPQGAGKSTLAAALQRRGYGSLADDVAVIDPHRSQGPDVLPTLPHLKLQADALALLGVPPERSEPLVEDPSKVSVCLDTGFDHHPGTLSHIFLLLPSEVGRGPVVTRLQGLKAMGALMDVLHRPTFAHAMGLTSNLMANVARLAASTAIYTLQPAAGASHGVPGHSEMDAIPADALEAEALV